MSEVWCTTDPLASFVYQEVFGLNERVGVVTQTAYGSAVIGHYVLSKNLEYFAFDVEEPVVWLNETEVVVNASEAPAWLQWDRVAGAIDGGLMKVWVDRGRCPLVFDRSLWYAKLIVDVNDTVANRVQESIFMELDVYAAFISEAFTPQPIRLFTANYSYVEQDYMQPFTARAYRLENGRWVTDGDV